MTWLWIALGALLALVGTVVIVGLCLPETYRAKGRADLSLSPEALWAALQDVERHPLAASMARGVTREGETAWVEDLGSTSVRWETVEADRPRRLVRVGRDSVVPMTARWELVIEPLDGGSRLWIDARIDLRRGTWHVPIFRVLITLTRGAERGVEQYLAGLAGDAALDVRWERAPAE